MAKENVVDVGAFYTRFRYTLEKTILVEKNFDEMK